MSMRPASSASWRPSASADSQGPAGSTRHRPQSCMARWRKCLRMRIRRSILTARTPSRNCMVSGLSRNTGRPMACTAAPVSCSTTNPSAVARRSSRARSRWPPPASPRASRTSCTLATCPVSVTGAMQRITSSACGLSCSRRRPRTSSSPPVCSTACAISASWPSDTPASNSSSSGKGLMKKASTRPPAASWWR